MADEPEHFATPLDELLAQAANGPLRRLFPTSSGAAFARWLAANPTSALGHARDLVGELRRVVSGSSTVEPPRGDRRFTDPAWSSNPLLRRLMQAYLAAGTAAEATVHDADLSWRDSERMDFAVSNLIDAVSPTNNPLTNPVAWKALIDTAGGNLISGPRNLLKDMSSKPRVPSMVDPDAYRVGKDLAVTPGSVVYRSEVLELIQYKPQTENVRSVPLLIIPPTINKFYVLDLAPGRSVVEYLVQQGQQAFVISWRNPGAQQASWGFDAYAEAILDAFNVTERIAESGQVHVVAACSGGLLACLTAAQRAGTGQLSRLASLSLLVTMIDQVHAGVATAVMDDTTARAAIAKSKKQGYLDGRDLAEVFAWLRPNDLIWNYWVNNYLRGQSPPKFDILFWNADTTRMSAALHRDFVESALGNKMSQPGAITVLGTPVALGDITVDSYVVAGSADHICPWENCYRSSQLLGGAVRFVLSTNGHIAALVNPPGNPKSRYQVSDDNSLPADQWRTTTPVTKGSWWPDYASWLGDRSGDEKPAPTSLGSVDYPPIDTAPGTYVMTR
ncbi:alpha/beta fold hydrolase [Gordonia sp. TBRC 11910]|uniref:Alpha/beta fold hydrolase n=1 Tax=Gordonia asplenii TaxID=2725283 RepID=A0A848L472_9ACTN|nr:alpha/beta fold hydrolase [Gordonia asplenii]NMO05222.1 alpha/beta fold hydrolase [Gordonia asplenii]